MIQQVKEPDRLSLEFQVWIFAREILTHVVIQADFPLNRSLCQQRSSKGLGDGCHGIQRVRVRTASLSLFQDAVVEGMGSAILDYANREADGLWRLLKKLVRGTMNSCCHISGFVCGCRQTVGLRWHVDQYEHADLQKRRQCERSIP